MLRLAAACLALAALPSMALESAQWPPPEGVEARMRELQQVIIARDSTPAQRESAREELVGMLKSPAGKLRDPSVASKRPARAAILDPLPTPLVPVAPAPPPPGGIAHIEVTQPPRPVIIPQTGTIAQPSGRFAVDGRTGNILHEAGSGFIDPRTGQLVPR